jgi:hypothetical protein
MQHHQIAEGFEDVLKGDIGLGRASRGLLNDRLDFCAAGQWSAPLRSLNQEWVRLKETFLRG